MSVGKLQFFRESEHSPNFRKKKSTVNSRISWKIANLSKIVRPHAKLRLGQGKGDCYSTTK